jgi:[pyruvate, water dikinase]-phosphate phosphotransferase / [pyruvate, water dikinase] kinase
MLTTGRHVFFISDRTGLTIEALGNSLLTQFEGQPFVRETIPFIDNVDAAKNAVTIINLKASESAQRPLVFTSIVDDSVRETITGANALVLDVFERFIVPLENEIGIKSSHAVGKVHSGASTTSYLNRIDAINYTLAHDDGQTNRGLEEADIILVGVSRSGKTPTSLYMAMQYGIKTANYPLIPEDLEAMRLPPALIPLREKLWGLTITPQRLQQIRNERRPDSKYSSIENCRYEIDAALKLMQRHGIRHLDSTAKSIEEIAAQILHEGHLPRRVF